MLLTISGQNVKVPGDVKTYAATKVSKLPRYYDHLDRVKITLGRGPNSGATARIIASSKQKHCFVAQETAHNAYRSIDEATRDLKRQLSKVKKKQRNHKHNPKPAATYETAIRLRSVR